MPPLSPSLHQTNILSLLPHCKTLPHLQSLHAAAIVSGATAGIHTQLLSSLTLLNPPPLPYALSLFHQTPSPSTFSHNLIIRIHNLLSLPLSSLRFFSLLRRLSLPPDSHTFPFALKASSLLPSLPLGRSLHAQSLKFGFLSDTFVINNLISMYSTSDSLTEAHLIFLSSPHKDIVSHNTIIDAHVKAGSLLIAREMFDGMPQRDVVSWGTLLAGYAKTGRYHEALSLFDRMLDTEKCPPDDVVLVSALSCCAQLGELDRGKVIHDYIKRDRSGVMSVYLSTGLVDMYAKCGCIGIAVEIFEASPRRNVFTWNAVIVGAGMHGHGELAVRYFERMRREGVGPDGVSFLGVLVGCNHAGLTDTARKVFDEMERVYGVERELKHYGCMADLLGRAGMIDEAMEMVRGMPMEADAYVWGGILGGCRIHGNVGVAEIAGKRLLEIDPEDSGIYSIMVDVYATARRWEDAERMRRLMNDRKVKKNVGCSSIEVCGVGDGFL